MVRWDGVRSNAPEDDNGADQDEPEALSNNRIFEELERWDSILRPHAKELRKLRGPRP